MEGGGGTSSATAFATGPWNEGVSWTERLRRIVWIWQILDICFGKFRLVEFSGCCEASLVD